MPSHSSDPHYNLFIGTTYVLLYARCFEIYLLTVKNQMAAIAALHKKGML